MPMQAIHAALRDAAALCQRVQDKYLVANIKTTGSHSEPVTIADYGAQAIICRALMLHCPDDGVIAEESGEQFNALVTEAQADAVLGLLGEILDAPVSREEMVAWLDFGKGRASRRSWVIDPIDGTKGFLARRHYAIACGLLVDGEAHDGMIATPGYNDGQGALFYTRGSNAWREPLTGGDARQIRVSQRRDPSTVVAAQSYERHHASKSRMGQARQLAGFGDARILELDSMEKYALVACGDADVYMRLPRPGSEYAHKVWDHAAGVALVQCAGGMATDLDGSRLDFSRGDSLPNAGMIISSGVHHQRLVAAVGRVMSE